MTKRHVMPGILSLALAISSIIPVQVQASPEEGRSSLPLITRELTGQNDGLNRYKYVDASGKTVEISGNPSSETKKKRAASLPSSYDSRKENAVTGIKDQGETGACWAFGALKSLESSSIRKGLSDVANTDLSESHLAWYSYHGISSSSHPLQGDSNKIMGYDGTYNQGGNYFNAIATLANWWGAAKEEDAPFTGNTQQEVWQMEDRMSSAEESLRTKSEARLTNARNYDYADLSAKKQAVMENGSMDVSLYFNARDVYEKDGEYSVYQTSRDEENANHCVTIIGWDDDFSSFRTTPTQGKGAWLIANSYGTDWGRQGCYWVSYYDTSLCEFTTFEADAPDNYDTNYSYDGSGYGSGLIGERQDISIANVYTNTSNSPQKISAAGIYTITDAQKYEISIYRSLQSKNPVDGDHVTKCTTQGTADYNGYHTIPLKESIIVAPGESFSVIVKYISQNNTIYAPIEGEPTENNGMSFGSQAGQSFIYDDTTNQWRDSTKYTEQGLYGTYNLNNVCLKAFGKNVSQEEYDEQQKTHIPNTPAPSPSPSGNGGNNGGSSGGSSSGSNGGSGNSGSSGGNSGSSSTDQTFKNPVTKITLKSKKVTIGKGEALEVTNYVSATPANTTEYFLFRSSNESAANPDGQGGLIGKKTGTAKITISTPSGKATPVTLTVTVKKAPSSVKAKAGKKTLKKGKTTKVKAVLPKNSASNKITFHSSNKKIATVNSKGVVKAKKKGTVKIKVKAFNGKAGTVKIKVK